MTCVSVITSVNTCVRNTCHWLYRHQHLLPAITEMLRSVIRRGQNLHISASLVLFRGKCCVWYWLKSWKGFNFYWRESVLLVLWCCGVLTVSKAGGPLARWILALCGGCRPGWYSHGMNANQTGCCCCTVAWIPKALVVNLVTHEAAGISWFYQWKWRVVTLCQTSLMRQFCWLRFVQQAPEWRNRCDFASATQGKIQGKRPSMESEFIGLPFLQCSLKWKIT